MKVLLTILFTILLIAGFSQSSQYIGSPTGIVHIRGAVIGDSAIVVAKRDTTNHPWKDSVGVMTIFNGQLYITTPIGVGVNKWSPVATGLLDLQTVTTIGKSTTKGLQIISDVDAETYNIDANNDEGSFSIYDITDAGNIMSFAHTSKLLTLAPDAGITTPFVYGKSNGGAGNLTISSNPSITKGKILFGTSAYDEVNNYLGIGTAFPANQLVVENNVAGTVLAEVVNNSTSSGAVYAGVRVTNSAGFGQLFKTSINYSVYKTLAPNDLGFYNQGAGNISLLNDVASGKIFLTAGAHSTPDFTISTNGFAGFNNSSPTAPIDIISAADGVQRLLKLYSGQTQANPYDQVLASTGDTLMEFRAQTSTDATSIRFVSMFIGKGAGINNAPGVISNNGSYNLGIGPNALASNTTGNGNTAIGSGALRSITISTSNTAVGKDAAGKITSVPGVCCLVAVGQGAIDSLAAGNDVTALGQSSFHKVNRAAYTVGIGSNVLQDNGTGAYAGVGRYDSACVAIGYTAGNNTDATMLNSVFIGFGAGRNMINGGTITGNVMIGCQAGRNIAVGSNKLWIANDATATPLIYGEFDNGILALSTAGGKFGIRTKTPTQALQVGGQVKIDTVNTGVAITDSALTIKNGLVGKVASNDVGPVILAKGTVTSQPTLDIDMSAYYASYDYIEIKIMSARPVTNTDLLWCRLSADAVTYTSTGYKWNNQAVAAATVVGVDDASASNTTSVQIAGASSNAATNFVNAVVTVVSPNIATQYPNIAFTSNRYGSVPSVVTVQGTGLITTAQITKAIRFLFSTGNISTITYKVIGYKN